MAQAEIREEIMEVRREFWKAAGLIVTVGGILIGGCSSLDMYARQQQDIRISAAEKQAAANCARISGMESDVRWIREALSRIELRQASGWTEPKKKP